MENQLPLKTPPRRICVLRLSAIGDVTHAIPLIRQIQDQWPGCEITWICGSLEHKLLKSIEGVRFVTFNKHGGLFKYLNLYKRLRKDKFDILIHAQVSARANLISLFIDANIRLGWDKDRSRDLHQFFTNHSVPAASMQHQQDALLSFGEVLGLNQSAPDWRLPVNDSVRTFVNTHIPGNRRVLVISACSSHKNRNWSAERYAKVADHAIRTHGMTVVLTGGPSKFEMKMAENITTRMAHKARNLVGKDTLEQLVGILSQADVVVSPDSGPAHLANAVGTKVIGLYACTWSKRSGPYNSLDHCVDKFEETAVKHANTKAENLPWGTKFELPGVMDAISVEEVCEKIDSVMEELNGSIDHERERSFA